MKHSTKKTSHLFTPKRNQENTIDGDIQLTHSEHKQFEIYWGENFERAYIGTGAVRIVCKNKQTKAYCKRTKQPYHL